MKYGMIINVVALVLSATVLSGCVKHQSSAERHASQFVHDSDDNFSPNYRTKKADSVRLSTPFFEQFRLQGEQDRKSGLSKNEASEKIKYFHSDDFLNSIQAKEKFAGKDYSNSSTSSPKWRKAMSEAASGAYQDGYEGQD